MTTSISGVWSAVLANDKTVYQSNGQVIDGPVNLVGQAPELHVFSGAVVTGLTSPMSAWTAKWASAFIQSGGTIENSILQSIVAVVSSGGVLANNMLDHTGDKIHSGGTAINNTKFNGGDLYADRSARVNNLTIGQSLSVLSGVVWSGGTVQSGGIVSAVAGSLVQDALVSRGGQVAILSGSTAQNVRTLGTGLNGPGTGIQGSLILSAGGTSVDARIEGGYMSVQGNGAVSRDAYVTSNGWQDVGSNNNGATGGGVASSTTLINGGAQFIKNGLAVDTQVSSGGRQEVAAGGTAQGGTVFAGGQFQIDAGGTGINNAILSGGQGNVWGIAQASNGVASGLTVQNGGSAVALSGGRLSAATLMSGGRAIVSSAGVMADSVLSRGGVARIQSGGTATGLRALGNGWWGTEEAAILIGAGGTSLNATLSGGYQSVQGQGAYSENTLITASGWQDVGWNSRDNTYGGGVASGSTLVGGGKQFLSGGTAINTLISSAGTQTVMGTGIASGSLIVSGGSIVVQAGGTSFNAQVASGGVGQVNQGGTAVALNGQTSGMTVQNGGSALALSGGTVTNFTLLSGARGFVSSSGVMASSVLSRGAVARIQSGGTASHLTASGNGWWGTEEAAILVGSGGTSLNATLSGGYQSVQGQGAYSENALVTGNGWQDVGWNSRDNTYGGGVTSGSTLVNGGKQFISGGTAVQTVVSAAGTQTILATGIASNAIVLSGGRTLVTSGGILSGGTIGQGGLLSAAAGGVYGGHISAAGIVSGGTVQSTGMLEVVSGGTTTALTVASGGSLQIDAGGALIGLASLAPGASATLDGNAGGTVNLGGNGYTRLTLTGTTSPTSIISGFNGESPSASDQIILRDIPRSQIIGVDFPDDDHVEFVLSGDRRLRMTVPGAGKKPARYDLSDGPGNSTIFAVCFLAGTLIRTPEGERAVETIAPGDLVYVYHNGCQEVQRVTWVGQRSVECTESARFEPTDYPVRVSAGALGDGVPYKDLLITPEHCLYLDGALIPARMLVNGRSITHDTSLTRYSYYHIETQTHATVMADGMLSETYLDTGNRDGLGSGRGGIAPGATAEVSQSQTVMAAPLDVSRAFVEPIWNRLARRAGVERIGRLTGKTTPRLHLRTEAGEILQAVRENDGCHVFHLPEGCSTVHICSPAARPSEVIGPFVDDRRMLGVLIGAMTLYAPDGATEIDVRDFLYHARGWHAAEGRAQRWTNGCAVLPLGRLSAAGRRVLAIQVLATGPGASNETSAALRAEFRSQGLSPVLPGP